MEKRSTNTNLTCLTQFLSKVLDQQGQVDVIYTDFSKVFDRIDHRILLAKLSKLGFSDALVTSGVPQGSN